MKRLVMCESILLTVTEMADVSDGCRGRDAEEQYDVKLCRAQAKKLVG